MRNSNFFIKSALIASLFYSNAAIAADLVITDNSQPTVTIDNSITSATDSVIVETTGAIGTELLINIGDTIKSVQNSGTIRNLDNSGIITGQSSSPFIPGVSSSNGGSITLLNNNTDGNINSIFSQKLGSEIIDINNSGTIGSIIALEQGSITNVVNSRKINTLVATRSGGSITTVRNNANGFIKGFQSFQLGSTIGTIINCGEIGSSGIKAFDGSSITEVTNNTGGTIVTIRSLRGGDVTRVTNNTGGTIAQISADGSGSTIGTINNSGTIEGDTANNVFGISATNGGIITTVTNDNGGIVTDGIIKDGIVSSGSNSSIITINNLGTVDNIAALTGGSIGTVTNGSTTKASNIEITQVSVDGLDSKVETIENFGTIKGDIANGIVGILVGNVGSVTTLNNNAGGIINAVTVTGVGSNIGTINNLGTINNGILVDNSGFISVLNNSGTINGGITLANNGSIGVINNSGTISGDVAIDFSDSTASVGQIINSGTIIGTGGVAINYNNTDGNILTVNGNSRIFGLIDYGSGVDNTIDISGLNKVSQTYSYNIDDRSGLDLVIGDAESNFIINDNGSLITLTAKADISPFVEELVSNSSNDISNVVSARLGGLRLSNSGRFATSNDRKVDVAALESSNSLIASDAYTGLDADFTDKRPIFWAEAFGSREKKSTYKGQEAVDNKSGGVIVGVDKALSARQTVGVFIGGLSASANARSVDTTSEGVFFGGYLSNNKDSYFLDLALSAGILKNNDKRLVLAAGGDEIARSSYNSVFFTPSVTIGKVMEKFIPSLTLRYTGQFIDSYQETGSTDSNLFVDNRYSSNISSRLQFESNTKESFMGEGRFSINGRTGFEADRSVGNGRITVTTDNGTTTSFSAGGQSYNVDVFVGFNAAYNLNKNNTKFYVDVETSKGIARSSSNDDFGIYGKLGFKSSF